MIDKVLPANIREFNEITGVIFAKVYAAFPEIQDIDADEVARTLGHSLSDVLESGRTFGQMLAHTVGWLVSEGFMRSFGAHPRSRVILTTKALAAMNAIPEKLGQSIGSQIAAAANEGSSNVGKLKLAELVGTLIGNFVGSTAKSMEAVREMIFMWEVRPAPLVGGKRLQRDFQARARRHPEFGAVTITATMPWRENAPEQEQIEGCIRAV